MSVWFDKNGFQGKGNVITQSGTYTLYPAVYIPPSPTASGPAEAVVTGPNVVATISTPKLAANLIVSYKVTAQDGATVTMGDPQNSALSVVAGSTLIADGGTLNVNGNSIGAFTQAKYVVEHGGTLNITAIHGSTIISALENSKMSFGEGGGTLRLGVGQDGADKIEFNAIEGFDQPNAVIEIDGATSVTNVEKSLIFFTKITFDNGLSILLSGDYTDDVKNSNLFQKTDGRNLFISASSNPDITTLPVTGDFDPVCYLADAMVETVSGEKPVQDLQVGDEVITRDAAGNISTQPIIWTGKSRLRANKALSDDRSGFPVRIKAGALAEKVPHRDLLVTSEHAIFLEGHFIPVRMLVNGRTIAYDHSIEAYDYYHFETARHSIVHVSGAATETFLDNGMRDQFSEQSQAENGAVADGAKQWGLDSAAPLCVTPEFVRDIYETLKDRANLIDPSDASARAAGNDVTEDPDLNIETVDGVRLELREVTNGWYLYSLPAGLSQLYLTSRVTRPCDALGPYIDDRRLLGVLVGEIVIKKPSGHVELADHLSNERLEGWSSIENHLSRWTSGRAEIILDDVTDAYDNVLAIKILSTGLHRLPPRPEDVMPKSVLEGVIKADSVLQPAF